MHGVNITCGKGEKSIITDLHVLVNCNIHGISKTSREIEVLSGEFEKAEEAKDVFVKPEDRKGYLERGP